MKDGNYITIQGWMVNRLHLEGIELMVYAIIYGLSQDKESGYAGGKKYLMEWTGKSDDTIGRILDKLTSNGVLVKEERPGYTSIYTCPNNPPQNTTLRKMPPSAKCGGSLAPANNGIVDENNNINKKEGEVVVDRACVREESTGTASPLTTTSSSFETWWTLFARGEYKDEEERCRRFWSAYTHDEQQRIMKHSEWFVSRNNTLPPDKRKRPYWYLFDKIWKGDIPSETLKVLSGTEAEAATKAGEIVWNCKLPYGGFGFVEEKMADAYQLEKKWKF